MIAFMILAAPRSGTTWAANWLTTDRTLCLHDPLFTHHYSELDSIETTKTLGISCTGAAFFRGWVNRHPARKVVLHRNRYEVNASLAAIGMPEVPQSYFDCLAKIEGRHTDWRDLFGKPREIYEFLTGLPFDEERHALLRDIEMQPEFGRLKVGPEVTRKLVSEMRVAMEN